MGADNEKLIQKTYRLPPAVVEFVEALRANGILGHTDTEVVRSLLEKAMSDLIKEDYVRKHKETLALLKAKQ